jgi:hypothetical protein
MQEVARPRKQLPYLLIFLSALEGDIYTLPQYLQIPYKCTKIFPKGSKYGIIETYKGGRI